MDTTKMITAGGTILASLATVALMVWQEAQASRYDDIQASNATAAAPVAAVSTASLLPAPAVEADPAPEAAAEAAEEIVLASAEPTLVIVEETVPDPATVTAKPAAPVSPVDEAPIETASLPEVTEPDPLPALTGPTVTDEADASCDPVLTAAARPAAIAAITLSAPCHRDSPVIVSHAGLTYSDRTDDLGTYSAQIPVLASPATITVAFTDGTETEVAVDIDGLDQIDRIALQWTGDTGLSLHAFEFGAEHSGSGHVWAGNPRDVDYVVGGRGGYLSVLGDGTGLTPKTVQVFSFPADMADAAGVVRMSVEAEVTARNCGRDISGETFQRVEDGSFRPVTLTLSMPGCDAVGEYLALKNLLRDLKVASN